MSLWRRLKQEWLEPFLFFGNNLLSLIGGALTTASAFVLVGFWIVSIFGHGGSTNPYLGIVLDLFLPGLFVLGLVLGHVRGGEPADVEAGDEVEVHRGLEGFEVVRTGLAQRAHGDATAGGGDHDVQATEFVDRGLQRLLSAGEVGDVDWIERAAEPLGNNLAVGTLAVQHVYVRATFSVQFGARPTHPRRAADDDDLLPVDLHPEPPYQNLLSL